MLAGWIFDSGDLWKPGMIGFAAVVAVLVVVVVAVVLARLNPRPGLPSIGETAALGESETREFKSSVCWNLRTGQRDEVMETVIAKTVSAFLNSGGGTLLIGVDDEGRLIGLDGDYSTLKSPDADRFELSRQSSELCYFPYYMHPVSLVFAGFRRWYISWPCLFHQHT